MRKNKNYFVTVFMLLLLTFSFAVTGCSKKDADKTTDTEAVPAGKSLNKTGTSEKTSEVDLFKLYNDNALEALKEAVRKSPGAANEPLENGSFLIVDASRAGKVELVNFLVDVGADVNVTDKRTGDTVLHSADMLPLETISLIVDKGFDVNTRNRYGQVALSCLVNNLENKDKIEFLLSKGADLKVQRDNGATLLHQVAQQNVPEMIDYLVEKGLDPNARDRHGWTPLHNASVLGAADSVKMLLLKGADKNILNDEGETAYRIAEKNEHLDVTKALK
jgi:ankyrin repeat protein